VKAFGLTVYLIVIKWKISERYWKEIIPAGSGLTGSLYQYKAKVKKCNHNTNIRKG